MQTHKEKEKEKEKEEEQEEEKPSPSRNASSKYDFVKVKVWLGENADHYYVLSRFLLCRMLTVTKVTSPPPLFMAAGISSSHDGFLFFSDS